MKRFRSYLWMLLWVRLNAAGPCSVLRQIEPGFAMIVRFPKPWTPTKTGWHSADLVAYEAYEHHA